MQIPMKTAHNLFDESAWVESDSYPEGTKLKTLRDESGGRTILLKLPEGFKMGPHSHVTAEQHFVLGGSYTSGDKEFPRGSYQLIHAHENHGPFESREGALILVVWDPFVET
jgi:anti-sigma factor ChrR (cupin superfamily)